MVQRKICVIKEENDMSIIIRKPSPIDIKLHVLLFQDREKRGK